MYIHESINGNLHSSLTNIFEPTNQLHRQNTRGASHYQLSIPKANASVYGIRCINYQSIQFWNFTVNKFPEKTLQEKKKTYSKRLVTNYLLGNYVK